MELAALVAAAMAGLAGGLGAGWHAGRRWGREEGKALAALELHRRALRNGRCPICGARGGGAVREPGLSVVKMHGLGNAYVYVDLAAGDVALPEGVTWPSLARAVADPHLGIGSDGLILMARGRAAPAAMRIFNADGSEGEMCGNGIRAVAMWMHQRHGLPRRFDVETLAGLRSVEILESPSFGRARVRVDMGAPHEVGPAGSALGRSVSLEVRGERLEVWPISVGNPHAVLFVEDVDRAPVREVGPLIERHERFPGRVNVEFVQVVEPGRLKMRVWERGSGETMACGTGACACVVAAAATGRAGRRAEVELPGGRLEVEWDEPDPEHPLGRIRMTGPARLVMEATLPWDWVKEASAR